MSSVLTSKQTDRLLLYDLRKWHKSAGRQFRKKSSLKSHVSQVCNLHKLYLRMVYLSTYANPLYYTSDLLSCDLPAAIVVHVVAAKPPPPLPARAAALGTEIVLT